MEMEGADELFTYFFIGNIVAEEKLETLLKEGDVEE